MLVEGDRVPDAAMTGIDGKTIRPGDFKGQKLILYFYPKDDTSGCTAEAQAFNATAAEFRKAGTWILGISRDDARSHRRFIDKYGLKIALASDSDGSVCEAFGTWVEKSMYGRKYMGIERSTFLVDRNGIVKRIWRKVKVPGHAEEVLAAAREIP